MTETWVLDYRKRHPAAAEWARGSREVHHSVETQGRVFRMLEQVLVHRPQITLGRLLAYLETIDAMLDADDAPASPASAAAAGLVGFNMLFGTFPPVEDHEWPQGFDRVNEGEAELAALGLQALGFDPMMIDGLDPGAYVWALFEMQQRKLACAEVARLGQHATAQPRCLAITREASIHQRPRATRRPESSRELVGTRR